MLRRLKSVLFIAGLVAVLAGSAAAADTNKPLLDYTEIARRVAQFPAEQPVYLTRAATFEAKSRLFPGATFGRVSSANLYGSRPPRQLQLGFKYIF